VRRISMAILLAGLAATFFVSIDGNVWAQAPTAGGKTYTAEELKDLTVGPTCITADCHANMTQFRFKHGPLTEGKCDPCHQSVGGKHVFKGTKGNALCLECHDPLPAHKIEHKPVRENCLDCHDVHGARNRFFILTEEPSEVCNRCHDKILQGLKYVHGPLGQGLCLACHESHESDNPYLLISPLDQFCLVCHEDAMEEAKNAITTHEPYQKECTGCHSGHGSADRYFLHASEEELCKKCHEKETNEAHAFKYQHEPLVSENQCSKCHTSHYSDYEHLLRAASMPLCLDCHNRTYEKPTGKVVADIQVLLNKEQNYHGPIRDRSCTQCHNAHGSNHFGMLKLYFPPRFYSSYKDSYYDLCWFCHDKKIVEEPESRATNFRNGPKNMHYLHVNREKGRTCRACHAEHASNNPVHIRDSIPYGRWTMNIEFEQTETGGSCATGCHARYGYDRVHPVQNQTTGPLQQSPFSESM